MPSHKLLSSFGHLKRKTSRLFAQSEAQDLQRASAARENITEHKPAQCSLVAAKFPSPPPPSSPLSSSLASPCFSDASSNFRLPELIKQDGLDATPLDSPSLAVGDSSDSSVNDRISSSSADADVFSDAGPVVDMPLAFEIKARIPHGVQGCGDSTGSFSQSMMGQYETPTKVFSHYRPPSSLAKKFESPAPAFALADVDVLLPFGISPTRLDKAADVQPPRSQVTALECLAPRMVELEGIVARVTQLEGFATRIDHVDRLAVRVEELEALVETLRVDAAKAKRQIKRLDSAERTNKRKAARRAARFRDVTEALQGRVNELNVALKAKDAKLAEHTAVLAKLQAQTTELSRVDQRIESKLGQHLRLYAEVKVRADRSSNTTTELEKKVKAQTATIFELEKKFAEQAAKMTILKQLADDGSETAGELKIWSQEHTTTLSTLRNRVEEHADAIVTVASTLRGHLAEFEEKLDTQATSFTEQIKNISQVADVVAQQNSKIAAQANTIERQAGAIAAQVKILQKKDVQLAAREMQITRDAATINAHASRMAAKDGLIAARDASLRTAWEEVSRLRMGL